MKAKFFAIAALLLGMASCQQDFAGVESTPNGEVSVQLSVTAPELVGATRTDGDSQAHLDSAYGAIDYLDGAPAGDDRWDWSNVDLRYSMEVYDEGDLTTPIKDRMVIIKDKYEPVTFELRLIPGRDYRFVVFADFVADGEAAKTVDYSKQGNLGLRHTIGTNLTQITIKQDADDINDEIADAYFKTFTYKPTGNSNNVNDTQDVELKRPYAKLRVVAIDLADLNLNVQPASVQVMYKSEATVPTSFNAVTGELGTENKSVDNKTFVYPFVKDIRDNRASHVYTYGYDDDTAVADNGVERASSLTLFTDYILAVDDVHRPISFEMAVFDAAGGLIKAVDFNTNIPVQRNHLTTIVGNLMTANTEFTVTIDDNFESDIDGNSQERILLETLINGGVYDLKSDLTVTAPTWLKGDAVIRLNGYTLTYDIPTDKENDNDFAIMTRVENGSTLTFVGDGSVVADGYIASANEGGVVNINGGNFFTTSCTLFQSNGGEINISGGVFEAAEYDGDHRYTLNFVDSKKQAGLIEVTGGRFYKYNPSESHSESPAMDFCGNGYWGVADGDWYNVVSQKHVDLFVDHAEVYTAEGLLQWAYIVENGPISAFEDLAGFDAGTFNKYAYGLEIMANIDMPAKTIVADPTKETYVFTDVDITVTDGVPSGSNWIPVCTHPAADGNDIIYVYTGWVDGLNKTISGLRVNTTSNYAGLIGFMYDGVVVKDLTFSDAVIKGASSVGVVAGRAQDDTLIENVRVVNSTVSGAGNVGSIVGYNYSRVGGAQDQGYAEGPAIVRNCSNDVNTVVICSGNYAGGIVGYNYGATIVNCKNYADVTGSSNVGGIVGYTRDYHHNKDGYIVACATYPEATITAKNGCVGGIAGYTLADSQHTNVYMHIVACTSLSNISGKTKGCIIGTISHRQHTAACVAVKNGATKLYGSGKPATESTVKDAILYDAVGSATQADIDALNHAIDHYNRKNPPAESVCSYRWTLVDGFPVLE